MQEINEDLFLFSRETLNRVIALSEMKKKDFYKGWISSSSLTFIANGQQDWSYSQVKRLGDRLKEVRVRVNENVDWCKAVCRNNWLHLKTMKPWDHKIAIKEVQKAPQYFYLPDLLNVRLNNPERFEFILPYVVEEARVYQNIRIDMIIQTVCEYQKKFENDRNF